MNQLNDLQQKYLENTPKSLPDMPFIYEENTTLSMHFDMSSIQSVMRKHDPEYLVLGYTRTMMGFLFFQPQPERIEMIGLGGGSLAKYCLKHLPNAHFTAVEVNPRVITLRDKFKIPADNEKFEVVCANGAEYVINQSEKVDVLLVDGFNEVGHPAKLCSAGFYDNCFAKLRDGGVMAVNLLARDLKLGTYTSRIRDSFEDKVVVVDAEEHGNKIAFAYKGKDFPLSKEILLERIRTLGPKHPIPLHNTAQKIAQRLDKHTFHSESERDFLIAD
jgi:spermidine synthase